MTPTIKFDDRAVQKAFRDYIAHTKRTVPEVLKKQIVQLAIGAKGVKGLFQEALSTRRATVAEIRALPAKLNYRIRRAPGFTAKREIARRIVNAGFYQASGWVVPGIAEPRGRGAVVKTQRGSISITGGTNPRATLKNKSPQAFEFGQRTGYVQRALNNRARDMQKYVQKKLASEAKEFSKPHPNFQTTLAELMRL